MKKYDLAYVIDCDSHGSFHEVINQGYLMMISGLYKKVIYVADQSACDNLKNNLRKCGVVLDNVDFKPQCIKEIKIKPNSISVLLSAIKIGYLNNKFYRKSIPGADAFFCNFLHFTALFNHFFPIRKKNNAFYMCHAEMEFIESAAKRGCFAHVFKWYLTLLFRVMKINKKTKYILLSDAMAETFKAMISPKNRKHIFGMDHCYIRPMDNSLLNGVNFAGVKIGLPGAVSPERGMQNLKKLVPMITNSGVRIYAISTLSEHICSDNFEELNKTGRRLPFEQYNSFVKQMDIYLMMYDLGSYKMTASAALLEAIWNEKPVLALKNVYFEYMFKKFGPLGKIVDSVEELADVVNSLTYETVNEYKSNLIRAKELLLPRNVKSQLERIINS